MTDTSLSLAARCKLAEQSDYGATGGRIPEKGQLTRRILSALCAEGSQSVNLPSLGSRKILSASGLFKSKCSGVSILGGFQKEVFIFAAIVNGTVGGKGTENTTKRNRFVY